MARSRKSSKARAAARKRQQAQQHPQAQQAQQRPQMQQVQQRPKHQQSQQRPNEQRGAANKANMRIEAHGKEMRQSHTTRPSVKKAQQKARRTPSPSSMPSKMLPFIAVVVASVLSAVIVAFGYPLLWEPQSPTPEQIEDASVRASLPDGVQQLGEYRAVSQVASENRARNIQSAARALNGIEIQPNETLSLNEVLGNTATQPSYLDAPEFSGSLAASVRGGGVCQVATALYVAALKSNLEIVERYPHAAACDYAPIGLDAALVYEEKDLRIKNNTGDSIYIAVAAQGQAVDVTIGSSRAFAVGVSFDALSKVVDTQSVLASDAPDGVDVSGIDPDSTVTLYTAEAYKVKYVDGIMKENTLISTDTYLAPSGA